MQITYLPAKSFLWKSHSKFQNFKIILHVTLHFPRARYLCRSYTSPLPLILISCLYWKKNMLALTLPDKYTAVHFEQKKCKRHFIIYIKIKIYWHNGFPMNFSKNKIFCTDSSPLSKWVEISQMSSLTFEPLHLEWQDQHSSTA